MIKSQKHWRIEWGVAWLLLHYASKLQRDNINIEKMPGLNAIIKQSQTISKVYRIIRWSSEDPFEITKSQCNMANQNHRHCESGKEFSF